MNLVLGILGAVGVCWSIVTMVAELFRWRISRSQRRTRIMLAIAVFTISGILGITGLPNEPSPLQLPANRQAEVVVVSATADKPSIRDTVQTVPREKPRSSSHVRSEILLGERERSIPEVVAAADDALTILCSRFQTVRGTLRGTQTAPDPTLQGLITTDLALDVTLLDNKGVVLNVLTVTSRGGGFSADASGLQARERLCASLRELTRKDSL